MKVVFLWSMYSGYMSSCWKALSAMPGVEVAVAVVDHNTSDSSEPTFDSSLLNGLEYLVIPNGDRSNASRVETFVSEFKPDVVVVAGWLVPAYFQVIRKLSSHTKLVVCSDNPLKFTWRQKLASFRFGWLFQRADRFMVAGELASLALRYMGVSSRKITKGLYGIDADSFIEAYHLRQKARNWPRNFCFVGRYIPRKGVDVLVEAYRKYRSEIPDPWTLTCYGRGELSSLLGTIDGVRDEGFLDPSRVGSELCNAGCMVLPSRVDHWPLVIAEGCAAGLPIICTSACGSAVELVRHGYNGIVVEANDAAALSYAFVKLHQSYSQLPEMGARSYELSKPYSADHWANLWESVLSEI